MKLGYLQLAFLLQGKGDTGRRDPGLTSRPPPTAPAARASTGAGRFCSRRWGTPQQAARAAAALSRERRSGNAERPRHRAGGRRQAGRGAGRFSRGRSRSTRPTRMPTRTSGIALLKLEQRRRSAARTSKPPLSLGKRNARAWNALGVAWMRLGAPAKAIDAWAHCVELNPEQYDALYNIGRVAGQLGDWKKAPTGARALRRDGAGRRSTARTSPRCAPPGRHVPSRGLTEARPGSDRIAS